MFQIAGLQRLLELFLALMRKFWRQISNFRAGCFSNTISIPAFSMRSASATPLGESFVAQPRKALKH